MAFNTVESIVDLNYRFNHIYYEQGNNLRDVGYKPMGFSDADIVEIHNYGYAGRADELRYYKERNYAQPDHLLFTIFDVPTNLIQVELHVILSEKRCFWRYNRETRGRVFPNFSLKLKIIQNPTKKPYVWTGDYWG